MRRYLLVCLILLLTGITIDADMELVTPDGRRVLLKENHTWEYVEQAEGPNTGNALLRVERRVELSNSCLLGLRLTNNMEVRITNLVPMFSAFTQDDVRYETVFMSFFGIKPTRDQYQEIRFTGIKCQDIAYVKIHGGDRCSVGELNKYSPQKGVCLKLIQVEPSDLVKISK